MLAGAACCTSVGPRIFEQDDFGDPAWAQFTYSISADCNASTISLYVMNASNRPVADANAYLKYVDFSTPLLSSTKTDKDGFTLIRLPGNVRLMRGLFILVIEKKGYRSKEIHFDLGPCFGAPALPPKPPANQTQNAPNETQPPANASQGMGGNVSGGEAEAPEGNGTAPAGNGSGGTAPEEDTGGGPAAAPCPGIAALLSILFIKTSRHW